MDRISRISTWTIFLFLFPPGTDISPQSNVFIKPLRQWAYPKLQKWTWTGITHLGFEFDSINMEVRLPVNKKLRALRAVEHIAKVSSVTVASLEEVLGILSHCCQVVPLGRPFLRRLFSLLRRNESRHRFMRTQIPSSVRKDIRWWLYFLSSWSSISIIRLSRINHDAATDASGVKGIGGVCRRRIFSQRVPARHRKKHINWKEMFAILHAFVLWHQEWAGGRLRLACDCSTVVQAIQNKSVRGEPIQPLQTILLIAAVFDIEIFVFWIVPSEENIVDAASRHNYKKLANLGFQASAIHRAQDTKMSTLRQKLFSFLTTRSPPTQEGTTIPLAHPTNPSASSTATRPFPHLSNRSRTGLPTLGIKPTPAKSYLSALRSTHIQLGYDTCAFDDLRIELVLRGGKRLYGEGEKRLRLPLTAPILLRIINQIGDDHDGVNLMVALCVVFAGFLRSGEFTWDKPNDLSCLARRHVSLERNSATVTLPSSKTDPFHNGVSILLAASPSSPLCPVRALWNLVTRFPRDPCHPLFSRAFGPFSRRYLVDKIKEMLLRAGIPTADFSGHSLRKGAAVSAAANGISRDDIKLLGRWKSDAVDIYINEINLSDHAHKMLQTSTAWERRGIQMYLIKLGTEKMGIPLGLILGRILEDVLICSHCHTNSMIPR